MSLIFRMLWVLCFGGGRVHDPLSPSVLTFRVWPTDLDLNLHVNNGRYFTLMDLGRLHLLRRSGVVLEVLRRHWRPIVGSEAIRFRRSLDPFQTFELHTRVLAWDERWFYMEQRFLRAGQVCAIGLVKAQMRAKDGPVPPVDFLALLGEGHPPMPRPELPSLWDQSVEVMLRDA